MTAKTPKAFKKGDLVTHVSDWDRKGSVVYRDAVVYSCGAKQMVLTDAATGEEIGRNFAPARAEIGASGTFPRMTEAEAIAAALAFAETVLVAERAHFEQCLAGERSEGYRNAIRRDLAALHEPRAIKHAEAHAALVAAVQARAGR